MTRAALIATAEEKRVIRALRRLAKTWPKTISVFIGDGDFLILRNGEDGTLVVTGEGTMDQDYILAEIHGIPADGGGF